MAGWLKHLWGRKEAAGTEEPEPGLRFKLKLLDVARTAEQHQQWPRRLRDVIHGVSEEQFDVRAVRADENCGLGKWIDNAGEANYGHLPAFRDLRFTHRQFHAEAGQVLEHALAGRRPDAQRLLVGSFTQRTEELLRALERLEADARAEEAEFE